jgi:hypothetical protein
MKRLPTHCPACQRRLVVKKLLCEGCGTEIDGLFELPTLGQLSVDDQGFILQFVKASGSLKEMARLLKLSYPTVRNYLDDLIARCEALELERGGKDRESRKDPHGR